MYNNYLPDFEADIARLALFVQQIGGGGGYRPPPPGTPMSAAIFVSHYQTIVFPRLETGLLQEKFLKGL